MMKWTSAVLTLLALGMSPLATAAEGDILGVWATENAKSRVEIRKCDEGLCGKIISLKEPVYPADDRMAGQNKVDRENSDPKLQWRPLIGLQVLTGFVYDGDGVWEDGTIYDPKNGKTYSCKITQVDNNTLKVRGYIGFSLLGRTTVWTR